MRSDLHLPFTIRKEDADAIYVDTDTRIQIVDTMAFLPRADKEQCAAFVVRASLICQRLPNTHVNLSATSA